MCKASGKLGTPVTGCEWLTIHSSRRHFAARLNSGVRPQWGKVRDGSCLGRSTGGFPVGAGHCSSLLPVSASSRLRPWRQRFRTRFALGFGYSAHPALPGKLRLTGCGIIGLRCVFQAGSIGPSGNLRPMLPNNSFKPTWLSPRGLIQALARTRMYLTLTQSYADRAASLIESGTKANLLYAALEIRMGVEARLHSYVQASNQTSSALKRGWEIHKLFKGLEKTFSNSTQVVELEMFAPGLDSETMRFIPVRRQLKSNVEKFGNALHFTPDSHIGDEWWGNFKESLVDSLADLNVCSKATLLSVPLQNHDSTQVQFKFEFHNSDPRIDFVKNFASIGKPINFRVGYIPTEEYYASAR